MNRRWWCVAAALCCACATAPKPAQVVLPQTVAEVWKLKEVRESPVAGRGRLVQGTYEGPGIVHVEIHDLPSSAMALDAAQKWRPIADTVTIYQDHYFAVVRWETADREAVRRFVAELEKRLKQ